MQPYQQRVVDEKRELDDKRAKLAIFLQTSTFLKTPEAEQQRLWRQAAYMLAYSSVLGERIEAFNHA